MASIQNNDDNLYWVFTKHGMNILSNLSPEGKIHLFHARVGSYDWYKDEKGVLSGEYTEEKFRAHFNTDNVDLESPVTPYLELSDKSVSGKQITLSFTVPENLAGFDIREVGIYETDGAVDRLFAVCTMQPLPKPSIQTNHVMSIQFNAKLTCQVLADAYDNIILNPESEFATIEQVNSFQENMLLIESTLAEQINSNTTLIGLNRPQQLFEQIEADKKKYSNLVVSTTYANFLAATSLENVRTFWVFNKTNDLTSRLSIADMSYYGTYLATDKIISTYEQGYEGLASWINFPTGSKYFLHKDVDLSLVDKKFTIFFVGAQNENTGNTILARDCRNTQNPEYRLRVNEDRSISLTLYTDENNYIKFTSVQNAVPTAGTFYVLSVSFSYSEYNGYIIPTVMFAVNGKTVSSNLETVGTYTGMTHNDRLETTSYYTSGVADTDFINSKVCILSIVTDELSADYIHATNFSLMALIGKDPCLI